MHGEILVQDRGDVQEEVDGNEYATTSLRFLMFEVSNPEMS